MVDMLIRREGRWLAPDRAPDVAQLERLRDGHSFYAKIIYRRSIQHHRWWRGLVHIVADGLLQTLAEGLRRFSSRHRPTALAQAFFGSQAGQRPLLTGKRSLGNESRAGPQ
jgi:hypothetical protein